MIITSVPEIERIAVEHPLLHPLISIVMFLGRISLSLLSSIPFLTQTD
jgi:hypothetical protein